MNKDNKSNGNICVFFLFCLRLSSIFGCDTSDHEATITGMTDEFINFEQHEDVLSVLGLEETDSIKTVSDLTVNIGFVEDIGVIEDVEEVEDPDGFYLDSDDDDNDDTNLRIDDGDCVVEECKDEYIEYVELDYTKYNMIPISVEHADEVALTLDKLVTSGKIQKDGIFYKYLKDVLQVYVTPTNYSWNPEVIEFFKTLKWLGGQSTVNMIRGPMWHGSGRGGVFTSDNMVVNLGGPSDRTLTKHSSGYTTESNVLNPLMQTFHEIIERKESVVIDCDVLKVVSVHAENDGTALQPALQFDPTQKAVVGLASGNIKIDYVKATNEKDPELTKYLKENIATEAVVTLLTNSPKTSSLAVGVSYCSKKGKTGESLKENVVEEVMHMQCCKACLENSSDTMVDSECCMSSVCETCLDSKKLFVINVSKKDK